ncbi:MAG: pyridoxamine 5-phosphate oxidase [Arcobacter sp.]|nr:MAG: pyridoxamine 5-phosphate oxidase [Arcobacter sp.]
MSTLKNECTLPGSSGEHQMQKTSGTQAKAKDFYMKQMLRYLPPSMQGFITKQEMAFISTSDAKGECDSSFRSGEAGFMIVLDKTHLIYAEHKGNGVMASMGNIWENPHIGLLFLDFLEDKVGLHVNGKASVIPNDLLAKHLDKSALKILEPIQKNLGNKHVSWVLIEVEEAYIHCSKNIPLFHKNLDSIDLTKSRPIDYFKLQADKGLANSLAEDK